jgi:flagellar basal-body rod protein FlgG
MVQGPTGEINYTRDGSFKVSLTDAGKMLATADGYAVLDDTGNPIMLDTDLSKLNISQTGELSNLDENGIYQPTGQVIGLAYFDNPEGLENLGHNLYKANQATGEPVMALDSTEKSLINQNFLESSNVQTVEEMVKLIVAQRAYELNSKAIQSSDEMLGLANNLRR